MGVCLCMCRQTCDLPDFRCSIIAFLHMYLLGTYRATWFLSPNPPQPSSQVSIASPAFSVTSPWSRLLPPHVATRCLSPPGLLAIPIFYWHHRRDRLNSSDPRHSSALCETASSAQLCGGYRDTRRDRSEPESLATCHTPRALPILCSARISETSHAIQRHRHHPAPIPVLSFYSTQPTPVWTSTA